MAEPVVRVGLVGSGSALVRAIEALTRAPGVEIAVVVDPGGSSEGTRRARSLGVRQVTSPMEVFRGGAEMVLELNGDDRQYERLLAIKPPRAEVLTGHGARLLIDLLVRDARAAAVEAEAVEVLIVVAADRAELLECFTQGFAGVPHVRVTRDRRGVERRQRVRSQASERRQAERRGRPAMDASLRSRGFVLIRRRAAG